jgi:membrane associated rhomboid family serine protease
MIPIADTTRSRSFPYVNVTIIVINFLVFFYEIALSQQSVRGSFTELDRFIFEWGNIPACTFDALGWDRVVAETSRRCGEQPNAELTPLTAMFMHAGWLHVIGNMLFLWIFGDNVEDAMGHVRYGLFYLAVGIIASLAHGLVDPNELIPAIGASGAVAGVMGAYLVLFPRATVAVIIPIFFFLPFPVPAALLIAIWFAMQLFGGFSSLGVDAVGGGGGVAYFAHIGGFIAGAALVNLAVTDRARARRQQPGTRRGFR